MKNFSKQRAEALAQQFGVSVAPNTRSTGADSPQVDYNSLANKPAAASVIYGGYVNSAGTAGTFFPTGWTVSKPLSGEYKLVHNLNTTNYAFTVLAVGGPYVPYEVHLNANDFSVHFQDLGGHDTDTDFMFLLTTQANP